MSVHSHSSAKTDQWTLKWEGPHEEPQDTERAAERNGMSK